MKRFAVGERVVACARTDGGYAEKTVVGIDAHGEQVAKMPGGVGDSIAGAFVAHRARVRGGGDVRSFGNGDGMRTLRISLLLAAVSALAACSSARQTASKAGADAKNAVSPIVGSWELNGSAPAPKANEPQFVKLDFKANGKLEASYVAAGGALAHVIDTPTKLKTEHDSYTLGDENSLSIIEGSRSLDYTYDVSDGKLQLTPEGASDAVVFKKSDA